MNNENSRRILRGDVYYANLGETVGSVQGRTRPVVIVQNNTGNKFSPTIVIVPLTSVNKKERQPTHTYIGKSFGLIAESIALAEQITTIDKCSLHDYIGHINCGTMKRLEAAILISVGIESGGEHSD